MNALSPLVIQERNASNVPTVSYTRGTDLSGSLEGAGGIGGLLARSAGYSGGSWTSHAYYHADGNGNITSLVNSSQTLAASYRYDPYGNLISKSGTLADANLYRFSSKELHLSSGLYYYLYRFYSPNLQRWINRDPIEEEGGMNLYEFCHNNPVQHMDSQGLDVVGWVLQLRQQVLYWQCKYAMYQKRTEIRNKAITEARQMTSGIGFDGGPMDTFRHCLAGCYLAKEMQDNCNCSGVPPSSFIREEEMSRSANKSKADIDNGVEGANVPHGKSCAAHCSDAFRNGRIKNEKPPPYQLPKP
jgi:RHS repeat-associated protein